MNPSVQLELVDSRAKRCAFLERVLATSPTPARHIQVNCTRLETLEAGTYDGILARALAAPNVMFDHARRLLRVDGTLLILLQGDAVLPSCDDFELSGEHTYTVGGKGRKAVLFRFRPVHDDA